MAARSRETPRGAGSSLTPRSSNGHARTPYRATPLSRSLGRDAARPNPFVELSAPKFDHFVDQVKLKIKLALEGPQFEPSPTTADSDVFGEVKTLQKSFVDSEQFVSLEAEQLKHQNSVPLPSQNREFSSPISAPPLLPMLPPLFDPSSDEEATEDELRPDETTEDEDDSFQVAANLSEDIVPDVDDPVDSFAEKYDEYGEENTEALFPPLQSSPPPPTSSSNFPGFVTASHFLANSSPDREFESADMDASEQDVEMSDSDSDDGDLTMEQLFPTRRAPPPPSTLGSTSIPISIERYEDDDMDEAEETEFFAQQFVDTPDPRSPLPGFAFLDGQVIVVDESEVDATAWEEARVAAREGADSIMGPRTQLAEYLPSEDVSEADEGMTEVLQAVSYGNVEDADEEDSDENLAPRIPHHLKGKERATTPSPPQIRRARSRSTTSSLSSFATLSEISFDTLRTYSAQRLGELCEMLFEHIEEMSEGSGDEEEESEELAASKRYLNTLSEAYELQVAAEAAKEEGNEVESAGEVEEEGEVKEVPFELSDSGGAVGQWSQNVVPYRRDRTISPNHHSPRQVSTPPRLDTAGQFAYPAISYSDVRVQVDQLDFAAILQSLADQRKVPVSAPETDAEVALGFNDEQTAAIAALMEFQQPDIEMQKAVSPTLPPSSLPLSTARLSPHDENGPTSKRASSRDRQSPTPLRSASPFGDNDHSSPPPHSQAPQLLKEISAEAYDASDEEEERDFTPDENRPPRFEERAGVASMETEELEEADGESKQPKVIEEISLLDTSDEEESVEGEEDELESPPASSRVGPTIEAASLSSPTALVDYASSDESIPDQLLSEADIAVAEIVESSALDSSLSTVDQLPAHPLQSIAIDDIVVREDTGNDMLETAITMQDISVDSTALEAIKFVENQLQEETLQSSVDPLDIDIVALDLPIDDTPSPVLPLPSVEELNASIAALEPQIFVPPILDVHPLDVHLLDPISVPPTLPTPTVEELYGSIAVVDPEILIPQFVDTPPHPLSANADEPTPLSIPSVGELDEAAAALESELVVSENVDIGFFPLDAPSDLGIIVVTESTSVEPADDIAIEPLLESDASITLDDLLPPHPLAYDLSQPIDFSTFPIESLNALVNPDLAVPQTCQSDGFEGHDFGGGGESEGGDEAEDLVEIFEYEDSSRDGMEVFGGVANVLESLDGADERVAEEQEPTNDLDISEMVDDDSHSAYTLSEHPLFTTTDYSLAQETAPVVERHLEIDIPMPLSTQDQVALAADTSVVDILTPIVERAEEERELVVAEDKVEIESNMEEPEVGLEDDVPVDEDVAVIEEVVEEAKPRIARRISKDKSATRLPPSSEDELTLVPSQRSSKSASAPEMTQEVVSALAFTPTSINRRRSPRKSVTPAPPFSTPPRATSATLHPLPGRSKSPSPDQYIPPARVANSPAPAVARVTRSTTPGTMLSPETARRSLRGVQAEGSQESPRKRTRNSATPEPSSVIVSESKESNEGEKEAEEDVAESSTKKQKSRRVTRSPEFALPPAVDATRRVEDTPVEEDAPVEDPPARPPRIHSHARVADVVPPPAPPVDAAPSTPTAKRPVVAHLPVTRSHCVFAKIQISSHLPASGVASARPYTFIVPSCALTTALAQETIKEFNVVEQGVPTTAEDTAAIPLGVNGDQGATEELIEQLVVEEDVRTALRRIVGVELLLEGNCRLAARPVLRSSLRDTPGKRKREDEVREEVKKKKV